jgi:proteasome lid subunit RPN8/RPN11
VKNSGFVLRVVAVASVIAGRNRERDISIAEFRGGRAAITLPADAVAAIRKHGATGYPFECCGALIGSEVAAGERRVIEAWPLTNTAAATPERRFTIAPDDYRRAEARAAASGAALLGFYHSHPDAPARPSLEDLAHAWPNLDYVIVSILRGQADEISSWRLREDRSGFDREDITWPIES